MKKTLLVFGLCTGIAGVSNASIALNITLSLNSSGVPDSSSTLVDSVPQNDLSTIYGHGKDPATVFNWVVADRLQYNANESASLPAPSSFYSDPGTGIISVDAGDYAVLHYGGALLIDYFATTGTYSVPQNDPTGQGISYVDLFDHGTPVPEPTTWISASLLCLPLAGAVLRRFKRGAE